MKEILNSLGGYFMLIIFILSLSAGVKLGFAAILGVFAKRQQMKPLQWAFAGFMFDIWTVLVYVITRAKIKKGGDIDDGKVALWFTLIMLCVVAIIGVIISLK